MKSDGSEDLSSQNFYYSRLQKDHFWFAARQMFLNYLLELNGLDIKGKRGLEIGCGNSLVSSEIEKCFDCIVDGVDLTNPDFRFETKGKFYQVDITQNTSLDRRYDFIVLFDIIEHIENHAEFVDKAIGFLKPGGLIFVNVPAYGLFYSRYDKVAGHVRRYDSTMLRDHIGVSGADKKVTEISQIFWGFFFVPLVILRKLILGISTKKSDEEIYSLGFTPPNRFINYLLTALAFLEKYLFLGTACGTSIMGVYRKKV